MTADIELAIRGGTVIDGTGRRAVRADVGIVGGRIVAIGSTVRGADEIDAAGKLVLPGFVDVHTHYDAQVLWDPELSSSLWQGVTSVVAGNCGFSLAPAREEGRDALLRTLETVEDMRMATMQAGIVWDFETYPEYLDAVERRKPAINFGGYVGHTAVRVYVMGDDASERCATETELAAMRAIVADALRGGALGFSTDRAGFVAGADGRPVPSMIASQDEVEALMRVTAEVGCGIVHIAPGRQLRMVVRLPAHARAAHQLVVDPGLPGRLDDTRLVPRQAGGSRAGPGAGGRRLGAGDLPADPPARQPAGPCAVLDHPRVRRGARH